MKKILVLILSIMVLVAFSSVETYAQDSFTIDAVSAYDLDERGLVYVYKDIIGYKDKEQTEPIYRYVASKHEFVIGETLNYITLKHFKNYNVFVVDGKPDTSWHDYEVK